MTPRTRAILGWEIIGGFFIIIAGSALHFVFDWFGGWRPVALIAAVNESIWEHLKLAFWPGLFWTFFAKPDLEVSLLERLAAKGFGLFIAAGLIVAIFTSYTTILGHNVLVLDIGTFVLAVVIGQIAAAVLSAHAMAGAAMRMLGLSLLSLQLAAYGAFTFYPPEHWLFVDSSSGLLGIPPT